MHKGNPKYRKKFDQMLVEHMAKGLSFASFGAVIDVSRKCMYEWVDKHPSFGKSKSIGVMKAQLHFERILAAKISGQTVKNFDSRKSDTACLLFALKTRFRATYNEEDEGEDSELEFI